MTFDQAPAPAPKGGNGDRPTMPPDLHGCVCEGGRVRTLPLALFRKSTPLVALVVAGYLDNRGGVNDASRWDSVATIADYTGYSTRSVEVALAWLAANGWILIDRQKFRGRWTTVYWLLWRFPDEFLFDVIEGVEDGPPPSRAKARREPRTTPDPHRQSADPCASNRADSCASTVPGADPCAESAQTLAPRSYESGIHSENVTRTLPERDFALTQTQSAPAEPPPSAEAIAEQLRIIANPRTPGLIRKSAACRLHLWGRLPEDLVHLVPPDAPQTVKRTPSASEPTTVEMIGRLANPTGPEARRAIGTALAIGLKDGKSITWIDGLVNDAAAGRFPVAVLASLYTEAKGQSKVPPARCFGIAVKRWRERLESGEKPAGVSSGKGPRRPAEQTNSR